MKTEESNFYAPAVGVFWLEQLGFYQTMELTKIML
jgi:hypothetical protein